jgi:hypothetical protein
MNNLAELHLKLGNTQTATQFQTDILSILESSNTSGNINTTSSSNNNTTSSSKENQQNIDG